MNPVDTKADRPIEELRAGDAFRKTLIPRADANAEVHEPGSAAAIVFGSVAPLWHGWAIMDAFLAGIDWARAALPPGNHADLIERAANEAYRVCAAERHVTLGDRVAAAIRALTPSFADATIAEPTGAEVETLSDERLLAIRDNKDNGMAARVMAGELLIARERIYKLTWQVRDTCTRAEAAEAKLAAEKQHSRTVTHERDWAQDVDLKAANERIEQLETALRPFAAVADEYADEEDDDFEIWKEISPSAVAGPTVRDSTKLINYRRARLLLTPSTEGETNADR